MLTNDILQRLRADQPALDRFSVSSIAVFGSFARGQARPDSDLDILVEYREGRETRPLRLYRVEAAP